jgi:hypothetical protein
MSPQSIFGAMSGAKKEKHYANSRAHRGSIVVSHAGSKKSKKDTDTESVSSEASTVVPPPPPKPQCPLRPYMEVMFELEDGGDEKKKSLCPLRRVKLSHTIPLCLFVMINMCLVIGTLLITGACRLASTVWDWGKKQPREVDNVVYKNTIYNPDFSAFTFLGMALFAFFVTMCYGPEWMSRTFQIVTTVGFFLGLSMTLIAKKETPKMGLTPPGTPTTPTPVET